MVLLKLYPLNWLGGTKTKQGGLEDEMNHFCHICNGLVDLIGMQPTGVKFCSCAENLLWLRKQVSSLKAELRAISVELNDPRVNLTITVVDKIKELKACHPINIT